MFSASSVQKIYKKYGYKLIDAIPQKTHGGSLRYVIKKDNNQKISKRLKKILQEENRKKINSFKGCLNFKKNVEKSKTDLVKEIKKIKKKGLSICGYGATSKSTTILNYCNIGTNYIDCIFDTTKDKIGKFSPGKHIPIKNHKYFQENFIIILLFA